MTGARPPAPPARRFRPGVILAAGLVLAVAGAALGFALTRGGQTAAAASTPVTSTTLAEEPGRTSTTLDTTTTSGATTTTAGYSATDTSYTSAGLSVTISEVTAGSGADTITYFVADVTLAAGNTLQAAFAGGELDDRVTEDTSDIAAAVGAVLAINGDNAVDRSDGIIIRNGVVSRDLPARMGLALFQDGRMEAYDERETSAEELLAQGVRNTFSFGPALLVDGVVGDDLDTVEVEVNPEHGIQGSQPRTGIGFIDPNHFVFVVVDGRSAGYSRGVTLSELAAIFRSLGCGTAYNLDGGGSSTMYFMGEVVNNPLGRGQERGVGDILYVG